MVTLNELGIAWVAGLLEGEGYFGLKNELGRRGNGLSATGVPLVRRVNITCGSTDEDVIRKLQSVTGMGKIYKDDAHLRRHPGRKPMFRWMLHDRFDAEFLLRAIRPHMSSRRGERIDEILIYLENNPPLRRRRVIISLAG